MNVKDYGVRTQVRLTDINMSTASANPMTMTDQHHRMKNSTHHVSITKLVTATIRA